jgi:pantoate--beta-alanine ligase
MVDIVRDIAALRAEIASWRGQGQKVALVPTMGALHAGHASLVTRARAMADRVVTTIFVNPTQFNSAADLSAYPRTESADIAILTRAGGHLLFAPDAATMYPAGHATTVTVAGLTDVLCGAHRPGHFAGVTTVVAKLLMQAMPDVALFGEKDYQQLTVIRRMVADLNIPVVIAGAPTVREADGLAMSSRNAYLTADERLIAPRLFDVLRRAAADIAGGGPIDGAMSAARAGLLDAGFQAVDYVEARAEHSLALLAGPGQSGRVFGAAHLGRARLIDNVVIET